MDSALTLRIIVDQGIELDEHTIEEHLSSSELLRSLTDNFSEMSLFPIWRLIALSEIPYSSRLQYTQELIAYIEKTYATSEGFSITGKSNDLLPCYNAMMVEAFSKLGNADRPSVTSAIEWIKKYQVFDRDQNTSWSGKGIQKYGGCMKSTPCYIGIAKTVKALIYYMDYSNTQDDQVKDLITKGTDYLLKHNLYQRLSNHEPITNHILDLSYPGSYQLNIIELLDIAFRSGNMNHPGVKQAVEFILSKKTKQNDWRINYIYKADGYVSFDKRGQKGEWITYLLDKYLGQLTERSER